MAHQGREKKGTMHNVMDRIKQRIRKQTTRGKGGDSASPGPANKKRAVDLRAPISKESLLEPLPSFREIAVPEERQTLFIRKLKLCSITFDFTQEDPKDGLAKEMKRQYLLEIVEHITQSKNWFSEEVLHAILQMVAKNLFRTLPPSPHPDFDPDEDDPALDPAWPHLQLVYEFLLRFVVSTQPDPKLLKRYIDRSFLINVMDLFDSEDPRERDYLKTILHRIYGKFMSFRSFIRKAINNIFFRVIYQTERHNGISELLEILGSIINGFALPLKVEHKKFLRNVLIPLHKVKTLSQFHQQLAYCVTQFIDKDPALSSVVVGGMLKFWPATSSQKELLFLNELEEVLELTSTQQLEKVIDPLFSRIGQAICSPHFQVAERALFLWNNDIIATFTSDHREKILPIIYPALRANSKRHWNQTVHSLTFNIIRIFMEMDSVLYDTVSKDYEQQYEDPAEIQQRREDQWAQLRLQAGAILA